MPAPPLAMREVSKSFFGNRVLIGVDLERTPLGERTVADAVRR